MKLKKPKFWDYEKPNFLSYLLLPFTFPVIVNNFFLNFKKKNTFNSKIKTICIGNIYIGGTAKTPLTIKIYSILNSLKFKTATIKKFYEGHIDEQTMLTTKTNLYCLKNRKAALYEALKDNIEVAIFDDGLQDQSMNYDLKLVCFNNIKWIGNGFLIPAGPLREKIESILKYDVAFINGNEKDNSKIRSLIKKHNKDILIFECYYNPININEFDTSDKYVIFSGIGNPESFREILSKNKLNIVKEIIFPDHYRYTESDLAKIRLLAKNLSAKIITTEKDFIKINNNRNDDIKFLNIDLVIKEEKQLIDYLRSNL
ncbi:tetraacyldisaccharide 4'-kinase [Candidatus Pelagibacter sp.]|nr:tetraacyldisaccharide 4'-kinase [Candidatus Pelagibacter sp.]